MAHMEYEVGFTQPEAEPLMRATRRGPMRILLMGDFSGRDNRGVVEPGAGLASRPTVPVDVDDFDEVLFRFGPRLNLALGGPDAPATTVDFKRLEDFHPDELYGRVPLFRGLREMRARLLDSEAFPGAAAELKREAGQQPAPTSDPSVEEPGEDDESTLARLLGQKPSDAPQVRSGPPAGGKPGDISALIKSIVQPYVVTAADPQQQQLVSSVDTAIGDQMRLLLRRADFQALEAAWRSVSWLVSSLETGEELELRLLDVTKQELAADLGAASADLRTSGLYRALVERDSGAPGGNPWSLLAGDYRFGPGQEDLGLLASLGFLASRAGGPFVAAADPRLIGCDSLARSPDSSAWKTDDAEAEKRWQVLRSSPAACWLGLALPRVLLRLPYGRRTDPVERFEFEESAPTGHDHEAYLWGNPAHACAKLIGMAHLARGPEMQPGDFSELDDLPAHTIEEDGRPALKPCAEVTLGEQAADAILRRGLMPLQSYRDRAAVRLTRFQSIADPPAALSGSWG